MGDVLRTIHAGVSCAFPVSQVEAIQRSGSNEPTVHLWDSSKHPSEDNALHIAVQTAIGPRVIECTEASVISLSRAEVRPLPAALSRVLCLSHIVGLAWPSHSPLWLVDFRLYAEV